MKGCAKDKRFGEDARTSELVENAFGFGSSDGRVDKLFLGTVWQ